MITEFILFIESTFVTIFLYYVIHLFWTLIPKLTDDFNIFIIPVLIFGFLECLKIYYKLIHPISLFSTFVSSIYLLFLLSIIILLLEADFYLSTINFTTKGVYYYYFAAFIFTLINLILFLYKFKN